MADLGLTAVVVGLAGAALFLGAFAASGEFADAICGLAASSAVAEVLWCDQSQLIDTCGPDCHGSHLLAGSGRTGGFSLGCPFHIILTQDTTNPAFEFAEGLRFAFGRGGSGFAFGHGASGEMAREG